MRRRGRAIGRRRRVLRVVLAIGEQDDGAALGARGAGDVGAGLNGVVEGGAAVGFERGDAIRELRAVAGEVDDGRHLIAERDDRRLVVGAQALDELRGRDFGGIERGALHAARDIDDDDDLELEARILRGLDDRRRERLVAVEGLEVRGGEVRDRHAAGVGSP